MKDLARAIVTSPSGLTRLVDGLVQRSWAAREDVPGNRRAIVVRITGEGREIVRAAWSTHRRGIATYFAHSMSQDDARTVELVFRRMRKGLG